MIFPMSGIACTGRVINICVWQTHFEYLKISAKTKIISFSENSRCHKFTCVVSTETEI
jgi:hypothetical protein